jgi:hypothetical protein
MALYFHSSFKDLLCLIVETEITVVIKTRVKEVQDMGHTEHLLRKIILSVLTSNTKTILHNIRVIQADLPTREEKQHLVAL